MKREYYKNFVWYPVTDETYWVEDYPDEFPNCQTIVCQKNEYGTSNILVDTTTWMGWGTMAKRGDFYFMIIEKP